MPLLPRLASLWRNLFRAARVEQDLSLELAAHLDLLIDAQVARGVPPAEARRRALLELGGMEQVKESVRAVRGGRRLEDLLRDLGHAVRSLRRSPGFTATVVLTLALGMGANAAIFSLVDAFFLRALPVPDPAALVFLSDQDGRRGSGPLSPMRLPVSSYLLYQRFQEQNRGQPLWTGLAAQQSGHTRSAVWRSGDADPPARADAEGRAVSASYFAVFGVPAFRGRTFGAGDETAPGANPVVVLGHRFWQRRFGGDPALVGTRLTINGYPYTVVGIAPPGFFGSAVGSATDFWVPLTMQEQLMHPKSEGRATATWLDKPEQWWLMVFGRLRPGVSLATAEASMNLTLEKYLADHPGLLTRQTSRRSVRIVLEPGARGVAGVRQGLAAPLAVLMAGAGLLLLIVSLNVLHLLLARASRRHREMGIRAALGATRRRLMQQPLAEALVLVGLAGAVALLITPWLRAALLSLNPDPEALIVDFGPRLPVLSFTAGLTLLMALVIGLAGAWRAARANVAHALQASAAPVTADRSRQLASRVLLTSQVAFSVVLLVGAGLLAGTLARLRASDKGFDEAHLLMVGIDPRLGGLDEERTRNIPDRLVERLEALPGVRSASLSTYGLLTGSGWSRSLSMAAGTPRAQQVSMSTNGVTAGFFETVGMRMLRGRGFTGEERGDTPGVVILNESAVRRLFGGGEALGKKLHEHGRIPKDMEVVGIVRDARTAGLGAAPPAMYYVPVSQQDDFAASVEVRSGGGDPAALADQVVRAMREEVPGLAVVKVRTMRAAVEEALIPQRLLTGLSTGFGLAALSLLCLGLYAVISQWAAQRTREIGVRIALGATGRSVQWLVLRQALALVVAGVAVGIPSALGAARLLRAALVGVSPLDPATLAVPALVLFLVAVLAAYLPARRASSVQPMVALRSE